MERSEARADAFAPMIRIEENDEDRESPETEDSPYGVVE